MPDTYSQIYIHVVFAVKFRQNLIREENREQLQKYISGIVENRSTKLIAIYCMPDHTHILMGLKPAVVLSDTVRDIKAASSKFINEKRWIKGKFEWQAGFGAFSCGYSQLDMVANYVRNQKQHHQGSGFKKEYLDLLAKNDVTYKEEYLFEWMEND